MPKTKLKLKTLKYYEKKQEKKHVNETYFANKKPQLRT